ncbi:MAG: DksA/TraR family C4-type zinc finger protein [Ectothiorhodospiraceae bacterium]|nr:DksA/TraR family C4-type zinc finger protein [Ectothiorhodospiraceae bacterium]
MATGWAKDGAVQEQIDASIEDAVMRARAALTRGASATECDDCGEPIPQARRDALPGVRRCIACQSAAEKAAPPASTMNRRASKDSLLR